MSIDVVVKEFELKDSKKLLKLVGELDVELEEKIKKLDKEPEDDDDDDVQTFFRDYVLKEGNKYKVFVAYSGKKIMGFIMGYPHYDVPELDHYHEIDPQWSLPNKFYIDLTFVSKKYRNQGVSKKLKRKLISYARKNKYKKIWSYVAKWNKPSIAANKSLGFKIKYPTDEDRYMFYLNLKKK